MLKIHISVKSWNPLFSPFGVGLSECNAVVRDTENK